MNNDHVPRTPHAEPSHEGKGMSSPGNDEAETSNAVRRRKTKHATRACNPCRRKYVSLLRYADSIGVVLSQYSYLCHGTR